MIEQGQGLVEEEDGINALTVSATCCVQSGLVGVGKEGSLVSGVSTSHRPLTRSEGVCSAPWGPQEAVLWEQMHFFPFGKIDNRIFQINLMNKIYTEISHKKLTYTSKVVQLTIPTPLRPERDKKKNKL